MGELPCQAPVFLERREKLAYVRARGKKLRGVDIPPSRIPLERSFKLLMVQIRRKEPHKHVGMQKVLTLLLSRLSLVTQKSYVRNK